MGRGFADPLLTAKDLNHEGNEGDALVVTLTEMLFDGVFDGFLGLLLFAYHLLTNRLLLPHHSLTKCFMCRIDNRM